MDHRLKCKNGNYKTVRKSTEENPKDFWLDIWVIKAKRYDIER